MATCLIGQLPTFYTHGACAVVLLCGGLAIGLVLGKKYAKGAFFDQTEAKRLVGVLSQLVDWDARRGR